MRILRYLLVVAGLFGAGIGLSATAGAAPLPNMALAGTAQADGALVTQAQFYGRRRFGYGRRFYGRPFYRRPFYGYRRPFYRPYYGYRRPFFRRRFF